MWWIWFWDWIVVPVGVLFSYSSSSCNLSGMYLCWPLRTSVIEMIGSAEGWCQWLGLTVYIWRIGEWGRAYVQLKSACTYSKLYPLLRYPLLATLFLQVPSSVHGCGFETLRPHSSGKRTAPMSGQQQVVKQKR